MSNKTLSEDFLADQMEVLEGWPPKEWDDAQDLSQALTEAQREAVWALYDRVEGLLWKVTRRQIQATDDVDTEQLEGALPIVHLRTLATYDHDKSHLTTWIWRDGRRHARREIRAITDQSANDRRLERALSQLYVMTQNEKAREPTFDEKVEYLRENVAYAREISREALIDRIASIEEQAVETRSLDEKVEEDDDDEGRGSALGSLLSADSPRTIDIEEVGRIIAEKTKRTELWEKLMGQEPVTQSFSNAKARTILLEKRARGASDEALAWEHQTSPFIVSFIEDRYDVELSDDEVLCYAHSQGYARPALTDDQVDEEEEEKGGSRRRALTDEEVEEVRQRDRAGETQTAIAEDYDCSQRVISDVVRGAGAYAHLTDRK
jgi:hypothetical protein